LTIYTVTGNTIWALKRRRVERVDWRSVRVELGRVINTVILERKKKEHSALHLSRQAPIVTISQLIKK